jgi:hypothetical protein
MDYTILPESFFEIQCNFGNTWNKIDETLKGVLIVNVIGWMILLEEN